MLYKAPTLKLAMEAMQEMIDPKLNSFAYERDLSSDRFIVFTAKLFDRDPKDIARKFLEHRIRTYGTGIMP